MRRAEQGEATAETVVADFGAETATTEVAVEEPEKTEKQLEIERLKAAEKFIEKETGEYECRVCSYTYKPSQGDGREFGAGTQFKDLPPGWRCPACRSQKGVFEPITLTIAGFADNQQYGFGGNSMTGEQKSFWIFGGLGLFFVLFISGYLME